MSFSEMLRSSRFSDSDVDIPDREADESQFDLARRAYDESAQSEPIVLDDVPRKHSSAIIDIAANYHPIIGGRIDPEGVDPELLAMARRRYEADSEKLKRANSDPDILDMHMD